MNHNENIIIDLLFPAMMVIAFYLVVKLNKWSYEKYKDTFSKIIVKSVIKRDVINKHQDTNRLWEKKI